MFNYLDIDEAHKFVETENKKGKMIYWDGWDIMIWRPDKKGFVRTDGLFLKGKWGTARRIKVNKFGKWRTGESL